MSLLFWGIVSFVILLCVLVVIDVLIAPILFYLWAGGEKFSDLWRELFKRKKDDG